MKNMVGDLNICSKKGLSERFDSTIGAATVLMPFGGAYQLDVYKRQPLWWPPSPVSMRWNGPQRPVWKAAWCAARITPVVRILTQLC